MRILKFGGKSLANGGPIQQAIKIIVQELKQGRVGVVVSARGTDTDKLLRLAEIAQSGEPFKDELIAFFEYHKDEIKNLSFDLEYLELYETLKAIQSLSITNDEILDKVVSYGEIISSKCVAHLLKTKSVPAVTLDSRKFLFADQKNGTPVVDLDKSNLETNKVFQTLSEQTIPVITGYIATSSKGKTTTLGRNGSNYTATLIGSFLGVEEIQNWTNIDGFYTADPNLVESAQPISLLSYREANELAQFGANIIHPKTILPLVEKKIPIKIKNSLSPEKLGTTIQDKGSDKGIKAVNVIRDVTLISLEGKGMADRVGIDAKIFSILGHNNISVKLISQASSERSIGFVVGKEEAEIASNVLREAFKSEIERNDISKISTNHNIAVIAITGRHNYSLEKAISGLRQNRIWLHLMTNSISGEHISLVVDNTDVKKAVNVVHNQVFGALKTLHVFVLGKGTVGKTFIDQILATKSNLAQKRKLAVKIVGIANSTSYIFNTKGVNEHWEEELNNSQKVSDLDVILEQLSISNLENVVFVDNTANALIAEQYDKIVRKGFDIIASNKIANTLPYETYRSLRNDLKRNSRNFLYETNVGAGLPIIDTVKNLVNADEEIQAISGVFSGSLSYIFNTFSASDQPFSAILLAAKEQGFTEPDPREDLGGNDVARKLLILAREIGIEANLEDISVESLIPSSLADYATWEEFSENLDSLDQYYAGVRDALDAGDVLRYVGRLNADGKMKVSLEKIPSEEPLAQLKQADSLFEIFTDSYGDKPIIIQGAGAGAKVTARGVYSDLIRIGNLV
jgi:aspartokinase/homoserine dehydrogenase 1